ncbi:hypothetical protein HKBW3S44_01306 [Candidatus Hakubella thermalkaliphila]|uniref:HEPN domain-containing protein n=2 Tax=Candidatus Hakubella thermalkaliphila TaxID=2754717 RepID=A0A6V8PYL1_9ACTN|nr:HEPN domain-containing protein [Candidatus Hakubella thermalkaliphila]MBT9171109.1 hypothetical protein [Actinomycetota bacterium]GFP30784.1 hypothetical protein HKBW3S34_01703 [Candidatus Hakubella thermalkaliphila]GFP37629.1 hypothetical protein HKBW3S44_01306 [Candidatus Hakubella thermalkaliphila]GFP40096.1 hypothetical protein HKBW3S47_01794 [Candidatus Hakubella thermalkaliphila]GFP41050.1 hypothetical protein HKBW3C_00176 [Candidatus Hakubella thermalkaliphila]
MNKEFEECLEKRKITKFDRATRLVSKEIGLAQSDLESAKGSSKDGNHKWSIIQAYYSMFHSARALIYSKGYRERSHYCLIVAMRALFVSEGLLSPMLVEALQLGKTLRENADYYGEFSEAAAIQMLEDAEEFLKTAKRLTKQESRIPKTE